MALKEYKLPFGRGFQTVMLPEEHVSDVLEGVPTAACDIKEATVECMRRPMAPRRLPKSTKGRQGLPYHRRHHPRVEPCPRFHRPCGQ